MCGRYVLTSPIEAIAKAFEVESPAVSWVARYNIAPGTEIPVVRRAEDGARELVPLHWGLVPSWMKERPRDRPMINARSETAAEKPSFRAAMRRRRCLVPADGFYEWKKVRGGKQPCLMRRPADALFAFAGIGERWEAPDGSVLESCALLTTHPNATMAEVHNRMPVVLPPEAFSDWLDPAAPLDLLTPLFEPVGDDYFTIQPVSTRVNSPRHDDELCLAPPGSLAAGEPGTQGDLF